MVTQKSRKFPVEFLCAKLFTRQISLSFASRVLCAPEMLVPCTKFIFFITSRIINMQSLVFNQLSAPLYQDLVRYGWRHLDPDFVELEYSRPRPILNIKNQFLKNSSVPCDVVGCKHSSYLRCSHCGKHLCLKHFLERACFHEDSPQAGTSGITRPPRLYDSDDDDYD